MLCQKCKKNKAIIYYNKIVGGKETEIYLCTECIKEYSELDFDFDFDFDLPFSIKDIFLSLGYETEKEDKNAPTCSKCNSTYREFRDSGKIGCSECYEIFKEEINPIIQSIHGYTEHTGKIPKKACSELNTKKEIKNLKQDLQIAIKKEEYELAAQLRDKIKSLERKLDSCGEDKDGK